MFARDGASAEVYFVKHAYHSPVDSCLSFSQSPHPSPQLSSTLRFFCLPNLHLQRLAGTSVSGLEGGIVKGDKIDIFVLDWYRSRLVLDPFLCEIWLLREKRLTLVLLLGLCKKAESKKSMSGVPLPSQIGPIIVD